MQHPEIITMNDNLEILSDTLTVDEHDTLKVQNCFQYGYYLHGKYA